MTAVGEFRHVVTLDQPGPPALDAAGGYTETWVPLVPWTWYCAMRQATAADVEDLGGATVITTTMLVLRGRYHAALLAAGAAARITYRGRTFEVASVHDRDERGIELEVIAREITGRATAPPTGPA